MKNTFIILIIIIGFTKLSQAQSADTKSESKLKKFEVGGHFTYLRRTDANPSDELFRQFFRQQGLVENAPRGKINEYGFGGRFTYNFTKNAAVEAEVNFFPEDKTSLPIIGVPIQVIEPGGRKLQAVFGPKIGIRKKKFGVFGKFRPGFVRFDRYNVVQRARTPNNFFVISKSEKQTFFNVDVGGVFEYYPTRKTVLRFDVGDTIIRYDSQKPKDINPSFTRNNIQISAGFGFRF